MDFDLESLKLDGEATAEQAAAIAEEVRANLSLLRKRRIADIQLWMKYRQFWANLSIGVDPKQAKVGPKQTAVDSEQLQADEEALAERAAAHAEETEAEAEVLRKHKEFWSYLVIFFLHFHGCSVRSILSVFQSFDIEGTERDIARCIEENKLLTYKDVLPDDHHERSVFQFDTVPEFFAHRVHDEPDRYGSTQMRETPEFDNTHTHPSLFRLTIKHPQLPAVRSAAAAARVRTRDRENRRVVLEASRKQIVITIIGFRQFYALEPLYSHYRRCILRAVGIEIPPPDTLDFSHREYSFS